MDWTRLLDPLAFAIVGGGTALGVLLRARLIDVRRAVAALATLGRTPFNPAPLTERIAAQARIARGHGALALDRAKFDDPDVAAAIHAIVDGADGPAVAQMLRDARDARARRHQAAVEVWTGAAELAPAMGMVGTLVGLAAAFATMTDPSAIGGAMAVALTATLYGVILANLVANPIAARLRAAGQAEWTARAALEPPLVALARQEAPRVAKAA